MAPAMRADVPVLDAPEGQPLLTVTGNIQHTNAAEAAQFDMDMLKSLMGRRARLETPWTPGPTLFEGPFLRAVLDATGARGEALRLKASNGYQVEIPIEDALDLDTILAIKMNGFPMHVRYKGPLFLIYPFDRKPELYTKTYFRRSVWQVSEIEVLS
jgi:hypothetical protein